MDKSNLTHISEIPGDLISVWKSQYWEFQRQNRELTWAYFLRSRYNVVLEKPEIVKTESSESTK